MKVFSKYVLSGIAALLCSFSALAFPLIQKTNDLNFTVGTSTALFSKRWPGFSLTSMNVKFGERNIQPTPATIVDSPKAHKHETAVFNLDESLAIDNFTLAFSAGNLKNSYKENFLFHFHLQAPDKAICTGNCDYISKHIRCRVVPQEEPNNKIIIQCLP